MKESDTWSVLVTYLVAYAFPQQARNAKEPTRSQSIAPGCRCTCIAFGVAARCPSRVSMEASCLVWRLCSAPEVKPMAAKCLLPSVGVFACNLATCTTKRNLFDHFVWSRALFLRTSPLFYCRYLVRGPDLSCLHVPFYLPWHLALHR